jgi:hypothetical protein
MVGSRFPMLSELRHIQSRDEFQRLVSIQKPKELLFYSQHSHTKRMEMSSLLAAIGITQMSRWKCLDIGPGYGDSLDIWHELGAAQCAFIERDPWLFTHNSLKAFAHGWFGNHIYHLSELPPSHFDFIWCKGGISSHGSYFRLTRSLGMQHWLRLLHRLAAPGAHTVICPYRQSPWMNRAFEKAGYSALPKIEGHSSSLYPVTWHKHFSDA